MRLMLAEWLLGPVLLWQGARVRRVALRLPEAEGPRQGLAGEGEADDALCLLIVGDSSAAGVGAATQAQALSGQLGQTLAQRLGRPVRWQLLARSGCTTGDMLALLDAATELHAADLAVVALGVNDATARVAPRRWLQQLDEVHRRLQARSGARFILQCALPPMQHFPVLPRPLRWWMGWQAGRLNAALAMAAQQPGWQPARGWQALPATLHEDGTAHRFMAPDGFHPNAAGYALWAEALAQRLSQEWKRLHVTSDHTDPIRSRS